MSGRPGLISVIVSTYNWPQALGLVLAALARQTDRGFEVVVADDGSTPETAALVAAQAAGFPVSLGQVWQEDRGFRAAAARNRAVAASAGDYLLFLDGDCLVRPDFVAGHRRLAEPGWFVAGNRLLFSKEMTGMILAGREDPTVWEAGDFLLARLRGRINRLLPLLRLSGSGWRRWRPRRWPGAMTCNLAAWRQDFFRVNGFNEDFIGWGHEDAEFVGRLLNLGVKRKEGRFAAPVLHLWHKSQDRGGEAENLRRFHAHLTQGLTRCETGVDRYGEGVDPGAEKR